MKLTLLEMFKELDSSSKRRLMHDVVENLIEAHYDTQDEKLHTSYAETMLKFITDNLGEGDAAQIIQEMHGGELA
jgi:hypothetical protein